MVALLVVGLAAGLLPSPPLGGIDAVGAAVLDDPGDGGSSEDPSYSDEVWADSPVSFFELDDVSASLALDSTGFDLTGSLTSGSGSAGSVTRDGSSVLAGSTGGFESAGLGLPSGSSPRSLEAWVELPCGARGCSVGGDGPYGADGPVDGWPIVAYGDGFGLWLVGSGLQVRWGSDLTHRTIKTCIITVSRTARADGAASRFFAA
ncbi:MAG: hypothetical protein WBA45_15155 [Microthrixaceae bacterium]